eukprot:7458379-Pyramimonas_sp.AAC.1
MMITTTTMLMTTECTPGDGLVGEGRRKGTKPAGYQAGGIVGGREEEGGRAPGYQAGKVPSQRWLGTLPA